MEEQGGRQKNSSRVALTNWDQDRLSRVIRFMEEKCERGGSSLEAVDILSDVGLSKI